MSSMLRNAVPPALRRRIRDRLAPGIVFDHHDRSTTAWERVSDHTMLPEVRVRVLYELARHCITAGIPGDFVECGVWKGGAVAVMAQATLDVATPDRRLHLFDAFTDICEPDPKHDGRDAIAELEALTGRRGFSGQLLPVTGAYDSVGGHGTEDICRTLLTDRCGYPAELIKMHVGWFQETVPLAVETGTVGQIAVLRLDGDYYASTKVCLDGLYDRVSSGGVVMIDDYGAYEGCRRAVHDFFDERRLRPFLHYTDSFCRYWIKE